MWKVHAFWLVYKCLQVCFYSAMKHEDDVSKYGWLSLVVRNYSFMTEIKIYIRASYIVFLFTKTENNNFVKEIKHVLCAFLAWWKPRQSFWEFSSRWKPSTASRVFTDLLLNSPKHSPRFSPGYEGTKNMFCFLNTANCISFLLYSISFQTILKK